eukprot:TRINITY_DN10472_c0_g1_i1.p1 TRINITY_DN10472_c0_g1~~TRINITY_DN10472_c0_g1_i1.p1  ORF type:complete len:117 (+),score=9.73 TRINITY_DN10472_c0_g1_i1:110-460(+)
MDISGDHSATQTNPMGHSLSHYAEANSSYAAPSSVATSPVLRSPNPATDRSLTMQRTWTEETIATLAFNPGHRHHHQSSPGTHPLLDNSLECFKCQSGRDPADTAASSFTTDLQQL